MLEFNNTFFILVVNFVVLLFILNAILFKPLMRVFKEREDTVKGALDAAKEMSDRKDEGIAKMNSELAEARGKAKGIFESLRAEAVGKQKELLSSTEAEAVATLEKARQEIRADAEKARQSLRADVDKFSDEIVRKLVNV
jgi:F-type H+-transporting ATPase subunit b